MLREPLGERPAIRMAAAEIGRIWCARISQREQTDRLLHSHPIWSAFLLYQPPCHVKDLPSTASAVGVLLDMTRNPAGDLSGEQAKSAYKWPA